MQMADLYTVDSLAKEIHCPPKAIKKWIKKGVLTAANLGGWLRPHYVMRKEDVSKFLASRETKQSKKYRRNNGVGPSLGALSQTTP